MGSIGMPEMLVILVIVLIGIALLLFPKLALGLSGLIYWLTIKTGFSAVINPDSSTRPMFPELLDEGFEPHEIPYLWIAMISGDSDTFVDITVSGDTVSAELEILEKRGYEDAPPHGHIISPLL